MENLEQQTTDLTTETNQVPNANGGNEVKTFNEEELNKQIQSAQDKVRTEYTKKMKSLEEELNKLKPIEKTKEQIELENRIKALEERELQIQAKEQELNITNKLKEQGLPQQLAKYLKGADDVETEIEGLKEIFKTNSLDNTYKPQKQNSNNNNKESITKEQFKNMSYMQRMNLFKTNEELYKLLSK